MKTEQVLREAARCICPLCNKRPVVIAACSLCWGRTLNGFSMTDEDKARLALFELAPMTPGHRQIFAELKGRWKR